MRNKIFILLACLVLSSCATPSKEIPTESPITPTATIAPTSLHTTATTATAIIPLTLEQIESKLEDHLAVEVDYDSEGYIDPDEQYIFTNEAGSYSVNSETGTLRLFTSSYANPNPKELLDIEGAKQVAIDELMKHCPKFFEYDYELEMHKLHRTEFGFHFQQLSKKGRYTGNSLDANVVYDGTIKSFSIWYNENPLSVDVDYDITEEAAIEIAYETAKQEFTLIDNDTGEDVTERNFDDRQHHKIETTLTHSKGRTIWIIEISGIEDTWCTPDAIKASFAFFVTIDSTTGEIINFSRSL